MLDYVRARNMMLRLLLCVCVCVCVCARFMPNPLFIGLSEGNMDEKYGINRSVFFDIGNCLRQL